MSIEDWNAIAARLTNQTPTDLDAALWPDAKSGSGGEIAAEPDLRDAQLSSASWPLNDPDNASIGIRVTKPLGNPVGLAVALIAMATERNVTPVVLSSLDRCGLEQFGLRIERLAGETQQDREICEEQLKRFHDITIVVDAENLMSLN